MAKPRMVTDIRVRRGSYDHLKIRKLVATFGLQAWGALVNLWLYACENAPDDGVLGPLTDEDLAFVSRFGDFDPARSECFGKMLVSLRLVDRNPEGVASVHDWIENQPFVTSAVSRSQASAEAGKRGGKASVKTRKRRYGTAQPPKPPFETPEATLRTMSRISKLLTGPAPKAGKVRKSARLRRNPEARSQTGGGVRLTLPPPPEDQGRNPRP